MYTSHVAVVEFVGALGTWAEGVLLKHLQRTPYYSILTYSCSHISSVQDLSLSGHWEENVVPEEKADAESINTA